VAVVALLTWAQRQAFSSSWFRWLPVPLWCYLIPALGVTLGWLPAAHPVYSMLTASLLPFALALLFLGVDLHALARTGAGAIGAAVVGLGGIVGGVVLATWGLRPWLPEEGWKGAGTLAATWTGGTMNLLSLRAVLDTPEPIFAALVLVDALVAYTWMALLVAASAWQPAVNRWLRAPAARAAICDATALDGALSASLGKIVGGVLLAAALASSARALGSRLPTSTLVSSAAGWTVLLVTSIALGLSTQRAVRRLGAACQPTGTLVLLIVLAATGAQARLGAFASAPVWLLFGACVVLTHGVALLLAGRLWHWPLGILATASQANIGGLVSAPLVGAVYHRQLAPVGLILAMAGNAVGTYVGIFVAALCRHLT
jgi:uncharacterized membrane protein